MSQPRMQLSNSRKAAAAEWLRSVLWPLDYLVFTYLAIHTASHPSVLMLF